MSAVEEVKRRDGQKRAWRVGVLVQSGMMFRIIDRYILREALRWSFLSLLILTFLLMIPPIMEVAQELIAKGVDSWTIVQLMLTLVPQGLGITIPMAVLIGLLMGLGRMSGDREIVVMQACGVSVYRLLYPVLGLAIAAAIASCYTLVVVLPDAQSGFPGHRLSDRGGRDGERREGARLRSGPVRHGPVRQRGRHPGHRLVRCLSGRHPGGRLIADLRRGRGADSARPGEPAGRYRADLGGGARRRSVRSVHLQRQPLR